MSELSSQARALVSDGRGLLRPTFDDRARVASALARRLGTTALIAATSSHAAAAASSWSLAAKLSSVVAAVGLVGAGAAYTITHEAAPSSTASIVAHASVPAAAVPAAPSPVTALGAPESPAEAEAGELDSAPAAARTVVRAPRKEPATGLTEEVALLSRATSALRGGDAASALEALEQHRRQFPTGKLLEERLSARAQALCLLGARSEAEVELKRLARVAPRSSHLARAERACKKN